MAHKRAQARRQPFSRGTWGEEGRGRKVRPDALLAIAFRTFVYLAERWEESFSFSAQTKSSRSVSSLMAWCNVTVHGFV